MRKLIVTEWLTLDGVFDADSMETWFNPFHSDERAELIKRGIDSADGFLLGRTTYQMLAQYWPKMKNNEMGAGLIDEYRFLFHPVMMGSGKRFFKDSGAPTKLKTVETKSLALGVIAARYEPAR